MAKKHELFTDTDPDRPSQICDRNGQVALAQCKNCGRAESELSDSPACTPAVTTTTNADGWTGYFSKNPDGTDCFEGESPPPTAVSHPDTSRLNWVLSFATGDDSALANSRTMLLVDQIYDGWDGREAVDAAMLKEGQK